MDSWEVADHGHVTEEEWQQKNPQRSRPCGRCDTALHQGNARERHTRCSRAENYHIHGKVRVWEHGAYCKLRDGSSHKWTLIVDAQAKMWVLNGSVRVKSGSTFHFTGYDAKSTPFLGLKTALEAFQILYIEMVRKYGLPLST